MPIKEKRMEELEKACSAGDSKLTLSKMNEVMKLVASEEDSRNPDFDKMWDLICNMADLNGVEQDAQEMKMIMAMYDDDQDGKLSYVPKPLKNVDYF